jgi:ribosome modulation factor
MKPLDLKTTAFNRGCDARLAGRPISSDPYESPELSEYWRLGWMNVAMACGREARWPITPLPPVEAA